MHTTGEVLNGDRQFPHIDSAGDDLAQVIAAARADAISTSKLLLYMAIQASRRSIWIENAYFVPDWQIREGLVAAARRGVDVRVIVPGEHMDSPNVQAAARYHYGELLDAGVESLRIPADDDAQQGHGRRRNLVDRRIDQFRQPLDEEERGGQHRHLRPGLRGRRSRR